MPQFSHPYNGDIYREVEHLNKTMHVKLSAVHSPNWKLKQVCPSGDLVFLLILTCCMDVYRSWTLPPPRAVGTLHSTPPGQVRRQGLDLPPGATIPTCRQTRHPVPPNVLQRRHWKTARLLPDVKITVHREPRVTTLLFGCRDQ